MKTTHSDAYGDVLDFLLQKRKSAGLTQEELASRLSRQQSFVSKYEHGERRLDIVEFAEVIAALDVPAKEVTPLLEKIFKSQKRSQKS